MTNKRALKVLSSWLQVAYQNADGTDESSAELYEALQTVFALINRQKEENEFLRKTIEEKAQKVLEEIERSKVEAIKEFAERLKEKADTEIFEEYLPSGERYQLECKMVDIDDIDDLVKEMIYVIS